MEYNIRPFERKDLPELLSLMRQHAIYEKAELGKGLHPENLAKAILDEPVRLFCEVVEQQGQLVGFVSYTYDYATWDAAEFMHMDCLFLQEQVRGLGVGSKILSKLEVIAREKGCINIQWQTPAFNEPAIRFYHKNKATSLNKVRFTRAVQG